MVLFEVHFMLFVSLKASAAAFQTIRWDRLAIRYNRINFLLTSTIDRPTVEGILHRNRLRKALHETAYCLWTLSSYGNTLNDPDWMIFSKEALELWRKLNSPFYIAHALIGVHSGYIEQGEF